MKKILSQKRLLLPAIIIALGLTGLGIYKSNMAFKKTEELNKQRSLTNFLKSNKNKSCYDRKYNSSNSVTDLHLHSQPFGGRSIRYTELMTYLKESKVPFALLYGIGQTLPHASNCSYYLNCLGIKASPTIKNDFENAANFHEFPQGEIHIGLSMTFPDLANPSNIIENIMLLDKEFPGLFTWMGEVNVMKQALLGNAHEPATAHSIAEWKPFMEILRNRRIPLALHSDLGNNADPKKFLYLMDNVLELYPNNKIIWMHMGLSKELTNYSASKHIKLMSRYLNKHPNLYLDLSWRVIADNYFNTPTKRSMYANFISNYPKRFLAGTDFVASSNKTFDIYQEEANITGSIFADVNDKAFRRVALGQNYFELAPGLADKFQAPEICKS